MPRDYFVYQSFIFKVGLELAPLMKAQPTGNPKKDANTGYMLDARLTSTDITQHAAQQTVQPWHSKVSLSFLSIHTSVLILPGQQVSVLGSVNRAGGRKEK